MILSGGILSALLTLLLRIDVGGYYKIRMIFAGVSVMTFAVPFLLFVYFPFELFSPATSSTSQYVLLWWMISAPYLALAAELICYGRLRILRKPKILLPILLSDLLLYYVVLLSASLISLCITGI